MSVQTELTPVSPITLSPVDRFQPLLLIASVGFGLGLAHFTPGVAGALGPLVNIGVLLLIYLVMLGLDMGQITGAFTHRRFLGTAILVNFVVNPLIAWALSELLLDGHPNLQVGLILFLVTPCVGWYLIFTELAGGDAGLGVSLLGINVVLQVMLLPVYLYAFVGTAATIDVADVLTSVMTFLVLPALAAGLTRAGLTRASLTTAVPARFGRGSKVLGLEAVRASIDRLQVKTLSLVVVIVAMFASQGELLFDNPGVVTTLLIPMLVFFVAAFTVAIVAGHFVGLPYEQTALLVFTSTSRNSEASLAIAATAFASPLVALTVVIGPVVELPLLVLMVRALVSGRLIRPAKPASGLNLNYGDGPTQGKHK